MIASAAARAHHGREEKLSREEAYRRSQLVLGDGDSVALPAEEELYTPLAPHYLLVPFKDCDYGVQDGQVSRKSILPAFEVSSADCRSYLEWAYWT